MSFKVEPSALQAYASRLDEVERVAGDADRYVGTYGNFSFHQEGIIGFAAPGHRNLTAKLHQLLAHLSARTPQPSCGTWRPRPGGPYTPPK